MDLTKYREKKKRRILVSKLQDILKIFSISEQALNSYRYILPAKDVLRSIRENRILTEISVKRLKEEDESKKN